MRIIFTAALLLVASGTLLSSGCGTQSGQSQPPGSVPPRQLPAPSPTVSSVAATPLKNSHGSTYTNPVIDQNFPDPSILSDRGTFYAYATNSGTNLPTEKSPDLVHWTPLPDAMPVLPSWVEPGRTWAPEVRAVVPGKRYAAYFSAHDKATNSEEIGVASGPTPAGPFTSAATAPLISTPNLGGAIDPSCFIDGDGSRYLTWKNDGNSKGQDTWLWVQKLSSDGLHLIGTPARMIKQDQPWEGPLVEAPTLWKHGGRYYLFYSANAYNTCSYSIGYAVANTVSGPYVKPQSTPWLAGGADTCGPGGEDIVSVRGKTWMVYHTWAKGPNTYRSMSIDPLIWYGDIPHLEGPSHQPQTVPIP